jgi:hypothetical protein
MACLMALIALRMLIDIGRQSTREKKEKEK